MSTNALMKCKCAICGTTHEYRVLTSTNTFFGSPDLDLRPPEMKRSTMPLWVQECPECGYTARSVSDPSKVTRKWLQSESYLTCDGIDFRSFLAKRFYRYSRIQLEDGDRMGAFMALLHAAWSCDDEIDALNAKRCRELAIPLVTQLIEGGHDNKDTLLLLKADLMRRAGQFQELIDEYAAVRFDQKLYEDILEFQIQKAKEEDTWCYHVADAAGDE